MVTYDPDQNAAAQLPSPRCPKCGSHRTVTIGMSQDLKNTYIRCNTCGARSEVPSRDARQTLVAG